MKKYRWWILAFALAALLLHMPLAAGGPALQSGGKAAIGGAFTLTDTHQHPVSDATLHGKPTLVYMGFSHCPDICPMTLSTMSDVLHALGPNATKVNAVFITLDPARDTPEVLANYLRAFDSHIIGLTGTRAQIDDVVKAYKVYAHKQDAAGGAYSIDHSGFLYLMDAQGMYVTHFQSQAPPDTILAALTPLL